MKYFTILHSGCASTTAYQLSKTLEYLLSIFWTNEIAEKQLFISMTGKLSSPVTNQNTTDPQHSNRKTYTTLYSLKKVHCNICRNQKATLFNSSSSLFPCKAPISITLKNNHFSSVLTERIYLTFVPVTCSPTFTDGSMKTATTRSVALNMGKDFR